MGIHLKGADTLRATARPTPIDERPMLAIWELTQACDLACVHCRACAVAWRDPQELSTEEGKKLLDDIAAMGTPLVIFTGGDPAKRPDLVELASHAVRAGLIVAVTPSGTALFQKPLLEQLKAAGIARIAVSVDGPDARTHDGFRRVEGSFDHSIRILTNARELGIPRQINTTLAPHNVDRLGEMTDLARKLEVVLFSVFVVVPTGRADKRLLLSPERLEQALSQLADLADGAPFDVKTTAAPHFRRILLERRAARDAIGVYRDLDRDGHVRGPRGINDGTGLVFVSHRGEIFPSGFLPLFAGNVREDSIADVYRHSPIFTQLRDTSQLTGKCGACAFKHVCGGSRARAWSFGRHLSASDPACPYVPRGWHG
jgi:radical SAM protein